MDLHRYRGGLAADEAHAAHQAGLDVGDRHGVRHLRYWYNVIEGSVFCLMVAPSSRAAAAAVHREAHGLVSSEIVEVEEGR